MALSAEEISDFIFAYARRYREEYTHITRPAPEGPGYPALIKSPFITKSNLDIYITKDGVVIAEVVDPGYQWYIAHGPAFSIDYEPTRTPPSVTKYLKDNGLTGFGIYRVVSKKNIPAPVWKGRIQNITRELKTESENLSLHVFEINSSLDHLVKELTFGIYGFVLDMYLPDQTHSFGSSHLTENLGMFPADLCNHRFFKYLEIFGHSDPAAWDPRIINLRVGHDIRRDLTKSLSDPTGENTGTIRLGGTSSWIQSYNDRLTVLQNAITDLKAALQQKSDDIESVFHEILVKHPLLLDVYGTCESKPEFHYPNGLKSPIGKSKLQPDFLIKYSDQSYKLVEIERPSKLVATAQGQPRAEVSQAVFQTAEWMHYIATHYQLIASRYPGIQAKCKTAVIMSRSNQESFKNIDDIRAYMGLITKQYNIDEFLTFDDLLERACTAHALLTGLNTRI